MGLPYGGTTDWLDVGDRRGDLEAEHSLLEAIGARISVALTGRDDCGGIGSCELNATSSGFDRGVIVNQNRHSLATIHQSELFLISQPELPKVRSHLHDDDSSR